MNARAILILSLSTLALAACGNDDDERYADCGEPTAIAAINADATDEAGLALPKGVETDIGLQVTDAEGDLCDPSELTLAFDDPDQVEIVGDDPILLKARYDAIDRGAEPTTTLRASLGDLSASWTVTSVVALGGTWDVLITEATKFPNGYPFSGVVFTQRGRRMTWEDCSISLVCAEDAVIRGTDFTVDVPDVGLSIAAPIAPDRNRFAGPWATDDGTYMGEFTAERVE